MAHAEAQALRRDVEVQRRREKVLQSQAESAEAADASRCASPRKPKKITNDDQHKQTDAGAAPALRERATTCRVAGRFGVCVFFRREFYASLKLQEAKVAELQRLLVSAALESKRPSSLAFRGMAEVSSEERRKKAVVFAAASGVLRRRVGLFVRAFLQAAKETEASRREKLLKAAVSEAQLRRHKEFELQ